MLLGIKMICRIKYRMKGEKLHKISHKNKLKNIRKSQQKVQMVSNNFLKIYWIVQLVIQVKRKNRNKNNILVRLLKIIIKRQQQKILKHQYNKGILNHFLWIKQKKRIKSLNKIIVARQDEWFYFVSYVIVLVCMTILVFQILLFTLLGYLSDIFVAQLVELFIFSLVK